MENEYLSIMPRLIDRTERLQQDGKFVGGMCFRQSPPCGQYSFSIRFRTSAAAAYAVLL